MGECRALSVLEEALRHSQDTPAADDATGEQTARRHIIVDVAAVTVATDRSDLICVRRRVSERSGSRSESGRSD